MHQMINRHITTQAVRYRRRCTNGSAAAISIRWTPLSVLEHQIKRQMWNVKWHQNYKIRRTSEEKLVKQINLYVHTKKGKNEPNS